MEHSVATDQIREEAALYALGALGQQEAYAFERHLRDGCVTCREEVTLFGAVANELALSPEDSEPPAHLRDELLSRIQQEERARVVKPIPIGTPLPQTTFASPVIPFQKPETRQRSTWIPWAVAACFAIMAAASILSWRTAENKINGQAQERAKNEQEIARLNARVDEQIQIVTAMSNPSDLRVINLAGKLPDQPAQARVYWQPAEHRWLVSADLPPAPAGKTYQLWFVTSAEKLSAGVIKTDPSGHGFQVVQVPQDLSVLFAAITLEPEGGSAQPTLPIYAIGQAG